MEWLPCRTGSGPPKDWRLPAAECYIETDMARDEKLKSSLLRKIEAMLDAGNGGKDK